MSLNNLEKLNVLYLTENLYYYSSSDYQVDFIKNLKKFFNLYEFGPGYLNFNKQLCYSAIEDFFKVRFDIDGPFGSPKNAELPEDEQISTLTQNADGNFVWNKK